MKHALALWTAVTTVAITVGGLAGCAQPGPSRPVPPTLTPAVVGLPVQIATPLVDEHWWKSLGDPVLDALIDRAVADHPSVLGAQARLARATAAGRATQAADGPQIGLSVDAMAQHYTANGMIPPPVAGANHDSGTVQIGGSWSLDFFGRHRAAIASAVGTERAAQADAVVARQAISTGVAHRYLALARLVAQREVAQRTVDQRQETLTLVRQRVRAGLDTQVDLRQAEAAVPDARTQALMLDEQIVLARHALAALTAQAPDALGTLSPRLQALKQPELPQRSPGADLLGRRAEVVAARWRIEAATQGVAEARAQFYPDVQLNAFAGLSSLGIDNLFQWSSRQAGIGPALRLPLFDAGRLRAQLQGRAADLEGAVAVYNGAVLDAVREAADALTSTRAVQTQRDEQRRALQGAEQAHDVALKRFRAGLGNYLLVLNTEQMVLAQRRVAVDLQARALDNHVQLMQALGGGYAGTDQKRPS